LSEYDAFISSRRTDGARVAGWLREALHSYEVPLDARADGQSYPKLVVYIDSRTSGPPTTSS
jgi:hypothetical protein